MDMMGPIVLVIFRLGFVAAVVAALRASKRAREQAAASRARQEALFQATFPELQPLFHPENVLQFVHARRSRGGTLAGQRWKSPPGFPAAAVAEIATDPKGEAVRLLDAADKVLARFVFQDHADGGVIRLGAGKFTANLRDAAVRYWHPEREFKWSRVKGWRVISSLSDRPIETSDRGTSFSSSSDGPSVTSTAAAAAAGAAVAGAGGAFDGGGSSESWSDGSATGDSSSESSPSY